MNVSLRAATLWAAVAALNLPLWALAEEKPAPPAAPNSASRFSDAFSDRQGANNWYYKHCDGFTYTDMTWDQKSGRWHGNGKYCQIWKGAAHPDASDAVIAWRAPRKGKITIRGVIERPRPEGDGTRARILHNDTQIWPSAGWQEVYPSFMVQHVLTRQVQADDWIYFHVNRGVTVDYDDTLWDPSIEYGGAPKFELDGARYVMGPADLRRMGIHTMDESLCPLFQGAGQQVIWFHSEDNGTHHQKFRGTLDAPAQKLIFKKSGRQFFTSNPNRADGAWWLSSIYQHADGNLLGFVHVERSGNGKKFRVGLAYSTNRGDSWVYLGHIIQQKGDPNDINITGVPYLIKDGCFYIYFADTGGPCVARAPVNEVMEAAKKLQPSRWSKYFEGKFDEPGLGGRFTRIGVENAWLHSGAAYSTGKKKYVLTGYNHDAGRGVWISFSDDAVNWSKGDWIQHGRKENPSLSPYITLIATEGAGNADVSDRFYAYWGFNPIYDRTSNEGLQFVVRQLVTLKAP